MLFGGVENLAGLGIFLPFTFRVLLGHKTLLAHEEQIEPSAGLARLAQSEIERAPGAANGQRMASPVPASDEADSFLVSCIGVLAGNSGATSFFIRLSCTSPRRINPTARIVTAK